jgi:hypothetical protein
MKPDKWLQPHCARQMGSLFPLTTSSGGRAPTTDGSKEPAARSKRGIDSERPITEAIYYPKPLHRQTAYKDFPLAGNGLPTSERIAAEVVSLPMHPYLTEPVQIRIVKAIKDALAAQRRIAAE